MRLISCLAALSLAVPALAQPSVSPSDIIAAAPASDWRDIPVGELIVMRLGDDREIVIQLAPAMAPGHVANILRLAEAGWFAAHAQIVRVQENYVVQWGDPSEKAALPTGMVAPADGYDRPGPPPAFQALPFPDAYGATVGFSNGWPVATHGRAHWLPHCPAMVGVGRNMPPDTGTGAELYAVIGHGPRHLDRNIAVVGRVLEGIEHLSALPRGGGALGFYENPDQRVTITAFQPASTETPRYAVLQGPSLTRWANARANRGDAFFIRPAGGADICNLMPPVRRADQKKK